MIFNTLEKNPISQILTLPTPKKQKTKVKCIDDLISTTSFHQFTKEELNSFFNLFSNGQALEILKNEYNLKSEISVSSLLPILNENVQFTDQNIKNIISFYILRCSLTFMSQSTAEVTSFSLKKMFQLLLYSIYNNNTNTTFLNISKQMFLTLLSIFIEKVNSDMLELLQYFFNIISDYYNESLIVLTLMTKVLLNQENPKIDSFLLDYTSQFILKATNYDEVKDDINHSISPLLKVFDKNAISFISKIITKIDYNELKAFLTVVPDHLLNYQENDPFFNVPDLINTENEIFQCDIEKIHNGRLLPFNKMNSFDPSFDVNMPIPNFVINDYFPTELITILIDLRTITEKKREANKLLSELFIKVIQEEDSKIKEKVGFNKLFDIAVMSLYVCDDNYLNLIILRSKIFSPNISTYDYQFIKDDSSDERKDYELIFGVRTLCLNQMKSLFSIIFAFVYSFYQYPLFVGDIFAFLTNGHIPNLAEMTTQSKDKFIEQLSQIAGDYQTIQLHRLANQEKISYSRIEILHFILRLLKKEENSQICVKNTLFMQLIISFLCEEKLRPLILLALEEVCTKTELDLSDCFSDFIKFIIIYNDDNKLRHDTLMSLNKIISIMPDYKAYFSELVDPLIDSLNCISKSSNENDENFSLFYMKNIFKFVSLASIGSSISSTKKILNAIQQIEGDDPSDETFNTLLNVITGNNKKKYKFEYNEHTKSYQYETIEIKYPSILGVFVKAFEKSSKFIGILQLLKDSCLKSRENSIKCHEGQLDLLLIDIIKELIDKNKNLASNNKDEEIVINSLQLFSYISNVSSSVNVVQNFFSLFNEIDDHVVSIFQSIFYIILNDLTQINDSVDEYLPINSNSPVVQVQGITNFNINNGFSVYLNIYLNNDENLSPKFFSISDDRRNKIELFCELKILKIRLSKNYETIHFFQLELKEFEFHSWNKIVFSFTNADNKFKLSTFLSKSKENHSKISSFDQAFDLDKNNLNIIFGGVLSSMKKGLDKSAIKMIGLYHYLDDNECIELFNSHTNQIVNKTIGTIDFLSKDNSLILSTNFTQQKINAKLVGPSIFVPNSFKNVLINNDMLLMIYPLLLQANFDYIDGKKTPDFGRILFMILINVLKSSLKAQILFFKSKGVECLAYILSQYETISFDHYQSIFQLFKKITFMPLKMEIMEKILLNMNVWINADPLSQLQVYRDWSRTLNTKFNDYTNQFVTFYSLLRDMRMFYWFEPVEKNIIFANRKEELNEKIVDIRSSILQILHTMSQKPDLFGYNELSSLVSHCTSCRDSKQVLDLLSFIRLIIVSPETPLRNIENLWSQVARLHSLLYSKAATRKAQHFLNDSENSEMDDIESSNENIVLAVIDIFVTLHFLKIIEKPKVNTHVSIIIDLLPIESITNHFFVSFFPFAMKYPEVTPLLFFLGMKMGETQLKIIVNKVSPDIKFSSTKYWDFYPVLFGLKFGGQNLDFITKFLAFSVHDNWDKVYQTISLVGMIFDIDTDQFKTNFLSLVCNNIMNTSSLFHFEYLHNFFDVALLHIFFRKKNDTNTYLNSLFMDSPFSSECPEKVEKPKSSSQISKNGFFEKLIENSEKIQCPDNDNFQCIFGLRFDKAGHWLDSKFARQLIQLSLKTKVQTFHNASSLLLAFLLRESPNDTTVNEYIQQLILKRAVDKPFLDFLSYIHKKEPPSKNYFEVFEVFIKDRLNINYSILNGISNFARKMEKLYSKMKEETVSINKICASKRENDEEADRILTHFIQNDSTNKKYTKEYLSNEDSVKTATNNKEYMKYKSINYDEVRSNFYNDSDCLVKYKEIKTVLNENNSTPSNSPLSIAIPITNQIFRQNTIHPKLQKENSMMFIKTPKKFKVSSQFFDEPISLTKNNEIDQKDDKNSNNKLELDALYYTQKDPINSSKVKFTVNGSKLLISNKDINHSKFFKAPLIFKEIDASEIKEMIFMPHHNLPIGIEIVTRSPKKVYYVTLLSEDALSVLKTINSFIEFKTVFIQTQLPNFFFKSLGITKKWRDGKMSNFEYLMKLNRFSGRTFCNIDSYPIFPRLEVANKERHDEVESRNLNEPISSTSAVSDPMKIISLLKNRLPFKNKFNLENKFVSSPRRSPRKINFISRDDANENDVETVELTPEFYYDAKYFTTNKASENLNDNEFLHSFEKIYNRRKMLEKVDIAGFVDLIWGESRDAFNKNIASFLPFQLFKKKHPTRKKKSTEKKNKPKKSRMISYHDELHIPAFVAHEMSSTTTAASSSSDYVYSFVCVDQKSRHIYRVDVDTEKRSVYLRDTWNKLQGNIFASTKIKARQTNQMLFLGISLRSIFSSQTFVNENENDIQIDSILANTTEARTVDASVKIVDDDSNSENNGLLKPVSSMNFELKIIAAFSCSHESSLTNMNDGLKTLTCRTAETSLVDSDIVTGVSLIACDKSITVTAGKIGSVVSIYRDFVFDKTVPTFRGRITAIDVSSSFGVAAVTTADGFLLVMDVGGSKAKVIQKAVNLNMIGKKKEEKSESDIKNQIGNKEEKEKNNNIQIVKETYSNIREDRQISSQIVNSSENNQPANSTGKEETVNNNNAANSNEEPNSNIGATNSNEATGNNNEEPNSNIDAASNNEATGNNNEEPNSSIDAASNNEATGSNGANDGEKGDNQNETSNDDSSKITASNANKNDMNDETQKVDSMSDVNRYTEFTSARSFSPQKVIITKKWGFILVYSVIEKSIENSDQVTSLHLKHRRSKLGPDSFTALSAFLTHEDEKEGHRGQSRERLSSHFFNEEDFAVGVIDVFSSGGDFIRRVFIESSIVSWSCFSSNQDFDFIVAAAEDGNIFLFEAFYAEMKKPILQLKEKQIEFLLVPQPSKNIFAFSSNGDIDVIPIEL